MTTVLIIGGGIAGVATAMALRKAGFDVAVHEAHSTGAGDVGAFLTIMSNGQDALRAIDAHQPLADHSFPADHVQVFDADGRLILSDPLGGATSEGRPGPRTLTRARLYRILQDEAVRRGVRLEHGKRLRDVETTSNRVAAVFTDGTRTEGDLLVGADGLHSTTREIIDPHAPTPRYTGLNVVFGYTPQSPFEPAHHAYHMIYGRRAFFGYTTAPDDSTWWFARIPEVELSSDKHSRTSLAAWKAWAAEFFADDHTLSAEIIRATTGTVFGLNTYDVPSTPVWYTDSIVLVGDAAHAASPAAGQGASMALEDGVILAQCLRDLPGAPRAFRAYERLRRERVERLVAASAGQSSKSGPSQRTPDSRDWLYGHHIDWDARISAHD